MIGPKVKNVFGGKFTKGSRDPQNRMIFLLFPNKGCAPAPPYFGNYLAFFSEKYTKCTAGKFLEKVKKVLRIGGCQLPL